MTNPITQADRELLAAEYEKLGSARFAAALRDNSAWIDVSDTAALRAIAAARVQAQGGREPYCYVLAGMRETVTGEVNFLCNRERQTDADIPLYTAPPPSAPVGAEALRDAVHVVRECADGTFLMTRDRCRRLTKVGDLLEALTQQPAQSAPMGVEALIERWKRDAARCKADGYTDAAIVKLDCAQQLAALAQQQGGAT